MIEKREKTQQRRMIDKLYADVLAWDSKTYCRLRNSGLKHEEALEYLRNNHRYATADNE